MPATLQLHTGSLHTTTSTSGLFFPPALVLQRRTWPALTHVYGPCPLHDHVKGFLSLRVSHGHVIGFGCCIPQRECLRACILFSILVPLAAANQQALRWNRDFEIDGRSWNGKPPGEGQTALAKGLDLPQTLPVQSTHWYLGAARKRSTTLPILAQSTQSSALHLRVCFGFPISTAGIIIVFISNI